MAEVIEGWETTIYIRKRSTRDMASVLAARVLALPMIW